MSQRPAPQLLFESKFLRVLKCAHWEYVQRPNATGAVIVVAMTEDQQVLFVDQFRLPANARVIEFPAGIVGDEPGLEDESLESAARRELLEETGYEVSCIKEVFRGASSAGMTDEVATFFVAMGAKKVQPGGGVGTEDIQVIGVPLGDVDSWLQEKANHGWWIDARIFSGLYLLKRELNS